MPVRKICRSAVLQKTAVLLYFGLLLLPLTGFIRKEAYWGQIPGAARRLKLAGNTFLLAFFFVVHLRIVRR